MIELGSGRLVPGFEEQLEGAVAGEERTVTITFPDDYGADRARGPGGRVRGHRARGQGQAAARARRRARRGGRLRHARRAARGHPLAAGRGRGRSGSRREFREAALDAAVAAATLEVPDALVEARARELWDSMLHSLVAPGHRPRDATCASPGARRRRRSTQAKPDAEQALRREAVLAAIAEAESLEPTEDEMLEAVPRRRRRASARRRRSCWSGCAPTAAWTPQGRPVAAQGAGPGRRVGEAGRSPAQAETPDALDARRPGRTTRRRTEVGPLLVFARAVRHGPSADLKDSSVRSETKRGP